MIIKCYISSTIIIALAHLYSYAFCVIWLILVFGITAVSFMRYNSLSLLFIHVRCLDWSYTCYTVSSFRAADDTLFTAKCCTRPCNSGVRYVVILCVSKTKQNRTMNLQRSHTHHTIRPIILITIHLPDFVSSCFDVSLMIVSVCQP